MKDDIKEKELNYLLNELKDNMLDYVGTNGCKYQDLTREEIDLLLDYITNLQEELKYQKQAEQEYNEKHTKLMKKYKELQERKDKAIEYLERPYRDNFDYSKAQLLDILKGE